MASRRRTDDRPAADAAAGRADGSPDAVPVTRGVVNGSFVSALHGLTTRGRSFLAAGVAAAVCAFLLGQRDLLQIGILLILLPLGCALLISRSRLRVSLDRTVVPGRAVAGATARVRLELANLDRAGTTVLLAEDEVPPQLGVPPRFVVPRLPGGRRAAVSYSVQASSRGRYAVGPLSLTVGDPFGMCETSRPFRTTDSLIVVPRTWPLSGTPGGGQWSGNGESSQGLVAASGEFDLAVREYRQGDDMRRVHWRSTARRGELMVRRDEQPRLMRASVLLDTRANAHRGEGSSSSFEWAVGAAGSIAAHLIGERYAVRLITDPRPAPWTSGTGPYATGQLLDRLALVQAGELASLRDGMSVLRSGENGIVAVVLGDVSEDDVALLTTALPPGGIGLAVLMAVSQWSPGRPAQRAELDAHQMRAADRLRHSGWLVGQAQPDQTIDAVWSSMMVTGALGSAPGRTRATTAGAMGSTPARPGRTATADRFGTAGGVDGLSYGGDPGGSNGSNGSNGGGGGRNGGHPVGGGSR